MYSIKFPSILNLYLYIYIYIYIYIQTSIAYFFFLLSLPFFPSLLVPLSFFSSGTLKKLLVICFLDEDEDELEDVAGLVALWLIYICSLSGKVRTKIFVSFFSSGVSSCVVGSICFPYSKSSLSLFAWFSFVRATSISA